MFIFDVLNSVPIVVPVAGLIVWNILLQGQVSEWGALGRISKLEKRMSKLDKRTFNMISKVETRTSRLEHMRRWSARDE
tara:strand:+ start:173 stop:409 length:237 start_codon:yes stop_codon:yes gene_type:complete